jgi:hypothetical protein
MSRIELTDSGIDVISKLSDGNPGAINVMMQMFHEAGDIDPDNILGGLGSIMLLDTFEIYGSNIWILYKDKCGSDLRKMIMIIRATQLGKFPRSHLQSLVAKSEDNLSDDEWTEIDTYVCDKLSGFKRP